jgi:hypothetical protein
MSISDRRNHNRFLCADLVRVKWFEASSPLTGKSTEAVLEDISALGACVQVEQSIPLNAPITLTVGGVSFEGGVCYSVYRDYGYFVGIRFAKDTEWSHDRVVPRHLTNLHAIATSDSSCRNAFRAEPEQPS